MSFADLKKNRSKSLETLSKQLEKMTSKGYSDPEKEKYWNLSRDAAGNGAAIIRFLPAIEGEDPFVQIWDHSFKGPGGWYIKKSLTTLKQEDPVSKFNTQLWNSGNEKDKEQARKQKRRLKYHSNILVIKDSANPENEGKVFLFAYGKKIFDKLNDLMNPQFDDETPINPFDLWEGTNFRLKIRDVDGYPNYDKSEFDSPTALYDGDDEKLEGIYNQLHSLKALHDPKNFETYEELEARLYKVLGVTTGGNTSRGDSSTADDMIDEELDMSRLAKEKSAPVQKSATAESVPGDDEADDDLEFFRSLANS
jgi:hypothetical protein